VGISDAGEIKSFDIEVDAIVAARRRDRESLSVSAAPTTVAHALWYMDGGDVFPFWGDDPDASGAGAIEVALDVTPCCCPESPHPLCRTQRPFQYRWLHGINAVCEFGMRDEEVTQITRSAARVQRHTLMDTLRRAQLDGELDPHTDIESLADFFDSTLAGMRIAAKAGKTRLALKRIAVVASIVFAGTKLSIQ